MDTLASVALVVLAASALGASLLGVLSPRRPHSLFGFTFFVAWLSGDLAGFHAVAKVLVTVVLVGLGAGGTGTGQVGVALMVAAVLLDLLLVRRQHAAAPALDAALREILGPDVPSVATEPIALRELLRPFPPDATGVRFVRDVPYGPHRRHRLDVLVPTDSSPTDRRPVLLQIHGGAWFSGNKEQQGQPLMRHLVRQGWVCVATNYRLSPRAVFPDHLVDVKTALAWVKRTIAEYGGDPDFVVVTGGSAGGHLAALVGLTAGMEVFQPGFEDVDTSVRACVPVYAVLDFMNTAGARKGFTAKAYDHLMSRMLMRTRILDDGEGWRRASPLTHVRSDLPPFLVVQGAQDTLVWREEARWFVRAMRDAGNTVVGYAEVPYAQHAFDVLVTRRSIHTVRAIALFLEAVRTGHVGPSRPDAGALGGSSGATAVGAPGEDAPVDQPQR